jgi:hypothetical protein
VAVVVESEKGSRMTVQQRPDSKRTAVRSRISGVTAFFSGMVLLNIAIYTAVVLAREG